MLSCVALLCCSGVDLRLALLRGISSHCVVLRRVQQSSGMHKFCLGVGGGRM